METKAKEKSVKEIIYQHIRSHNRTMTDEFLKSLSYGELLCECHPLDRDYFSKMLHPVTK